MAPRASIVVPAHNEGARIGGLLEDVSTLAAAGEIDVIVVCNACTDETVEVASGRGGVRVVEVSAPGKSHALNVGDREAGDLFPRLYCDADLRIQAGAVEALIRALDVEDARAVGPHVTYSVEGVSWVVRRFHEALGAPVIADWLERHLVGRGLYGTNRVGRSRFGEFPTLIADDLYFDAQFADVERIVVESAQVVVPVPPTVRALVRREIRVAAGNSDLHRGAGRAGLAPHLEVRAANLGGRAANLARFTRRLRLRDVAPLAVHLSVVGAARVALRFRSRRGPGPAWR
ncbi:MAG: glycosyltransferase family 2 protein [Acidimicrobiales bacterium]